MVISFPESASYSSGNAAEISRFACKTYLRLLRLIWPQLIYFRLASSLESFPRNNSLSTLPYRASVSSHKFARHLTLGLTTWTGPIKCLNVFQLTACHFTSGLYKIFQSRIPYICNGHFIRAFFVFLTLWLHDPLTALTTIVTFSHSSISTAFCFHYVTVISRRSFSTYSSHLSLGFPLILLPPGLLSYISLTILPLPILTTRPTHSNICYCV